MTALISDCGKYRLALTRTITGLDSDRRILFIMLNPSTADASKDDPTIRRCLSFARRDQCSMVTVVNLYALRATNPAELLTSPDPIGPGNPEMVRHEIDLHRRDGGLIIAAWGSSKQPSPIMVRYVKEWLNGSGLCLGMNKDRSPKHPLYVRGDSPLVRFP